MSIEIMDRDGEGGVWYLPRQFGKVPEVVRISCQEMARKNLAELRRLSLALRHMDEREGRVCPSFDWSFTATREPLLAYLGYGWQAAQETLLNAGNNPLEVDGVESPTGQQDISRHEAMVSETKSRLEEEGFDVKVQGPEGFQSLWVTFPDGTDTVVTFPRNPTTSNFEDEEAYRRVLERWHASGRVAIQNPQVHSTSDASSSTNKPSGPGNPLADAYNRVYERWKDSGHTVVDPPTSRTTKNSGDDAVGGNHRTNPKHFTQQARQDSSNKPSAPDNPLAAAYETLTAQLIDSGLTVTDLPTSRTQQSVVSFPRTKPSNRRGNSVRWVFERDGSGGIRCTETAKDGRERVGSITANQLHQMSYERLARVGRVMFGEDERTRLPHPTAEWFSAASQRDLLDYIQNGWNQDTETNPDGSHLSHQSTQPSHSPNLGAGSDAEPDSSSVRVITNEGDRKSRSGLREVLPMFNFLFYLCVGLFQLAAIISGIEEWWGFHWLISLPVALVVAYLPILGTIVGIMGAIEAWDWEPFAAIALFAIPACIPFIAIGIMAILDSIRSPS